MNDSVRGTALPETAIVLSVVLLVIFGITQLSLMGFYQAAAEGAAFIGAHALSLNSTGAGTSADQTYAAGIVPTPFPIVKSTDIHVLYPASGLVQVWVDKNPGGLLMVPGAASSVNVQGADIEPILGNASLATPKPFSIADQAVLKNYCSFKNCAPPSSYTMYLAQCYQGAEGACGKNNGNGVNGAFAEWNCRQDLFVAMANAVEGVSWPAGTVAPGTKGGAWDPDPNNKSFNTAETNVYAFDSQTSKWGSSPSC